MISGKQTINVLITVCFIIVVVLPCSCSRSVVPKILTGRGTTEYDRAAEEYLLVEAMRQKLTGNPGEALKNLEQVLKINPVNDAAHYQMAQIVAGLGDVSGGKKYLTKAISISPDNRWYILMMAGLQYQDGNIDSTLFYYEKLVKRFPDNEGYLMSLGNLYAENKRFDKAGEIFNMIDSKYGVNQISTIALVRSLMSEKKYQEARQKIEELINQEPDEIMYRGMMAEIYRIEGRPDKATEVYKELLGRNPDNPQTQLSMCEFLIEQKNYEELMDLITTIILNDKVGREDKIALIAEMIQNDEIIKDHSKGIELAVRVMEANYENDDIVLLLRPELYDRQKRTGEAAGRLEEIIAKRPDNYFAWERLLMIYYTERMYKELVEKGEQCATRFNRSFIAKMLYSTGASETGDFDTALNELRKAEILAGDNKELLIQVFTLRGDVYYKKKDYENAFKTFEKALEIDNNDLTVINNYAYYLTEQGMRLREAEKMAKYVIERDDKNTAFLDTYAWALYKNGKAGKAEKIMEKVIGMGEEPNAEWYEHYGYIMKKRGKCREAINKWEYALELDSSRTDLIIEIENCRK